VMPEEADVGANNATAIDEEDQPQPADASSLEEASGAAVVDDLMAAEQPPDDDHDADEAVDADDDDDVPEVAATSPEAASGDEEVVSEDAEEDSVPPPLDDEEDADDDQRDVPAEEEDSRAGAPPSEEEEEEQNTAPQEAAPRPPVRRPDPRDIPGGPGLDVFGGALGGHDAGPAGFDDLDDFSHEADPYGGGAAYGYGDDGFAFGDDDDIRDDEDEIPDDVFPDDDDDGRLAWDDGDHLRHYYESDADRLDEAAAAAAGPPRHVDPALEFATYRPRDDKAYLPEWRRRTLKRLEGEVKDLEKATKKRQRKIDDAEAALPSGDRYGDDGALWPLRETCLKNFKSSGYAYTICLFKDAKQDHTRLGTFREARKDARGRVTALEFAGGATCWNGPARSLRVDLVCGAGATEVLDIDEPETCVYVAHVATPAACFLDDDDDDDDAAAFECVSGDLPTGAGTPGRGLAEALARPLDAARRWLFRSSRRDS